MTTELIEIAFGYGPKDASPDFIPMNDLPGGRNRQRNLTITRTRSDELQRYDSFPATTLLSNPDAALNPENSASPYDVSPSTPFRYKLNSVVTYYGFTAGFPQTEQEYGKDPVVNLAALDRLSLLNRRPFQGATIFEEALAGQRFYDVLVTKLGYASGDVDLDTGTVTVAKSFDLVNTNPLDHLQEIALAEGGRFFASKDGKFTFQDRTACLGMLTTSHGVFGNENSTQIPFRLINDEITHDASKIYNGVHITDSTGGVYDAEDVASQNQNGEIDYTQTWPILPGDAQNRGGHILDDYKDAHRRIPALEIMHTRNPSVCWPIINALEIGQRFGFRYQPLAAGSDLIELDVVVDGISINSVPGEFRPIVQLSPVDMRPYWLLEVPGYTGIETETFLY